MAEQRNERTEDSTITFTMDKEREAYIRNIITIVYEALRIKGYDPVSQIVGYLLTEDPTYITNYNNARSIIRKVDRDELLNIIVSNYISQ